MIKYVQSKEINYPRIQELLKQSQNLNIYTNNGPVKKQLEQKLHDLLKLPNHKTIICTNSGTAALFVLMSYYTSLNPSMTWGTTSFNFPTPVVNRLSCSVVDIDPQTLNAKLEDVAKYDGFILTTLFGTIPENFGQIVEYCQKHSKILILDNASSPLTSVISSNNQFNINSYGDASIGSLHHTKFIGFGEGGYLVIDESLRDHLVSLTNFGFTDDRKYNHYASNAKISDIAASFILSHMETYSLQDHRRVQFDCVSAIRSMSNVRVFPTASYSDCILGNLPLIFNKPTSHLVFRDVSIEANKYYKPLKDLPVSKDLFDRIINLPLHSKLTDYEIELMLKKVEMVSKL